MKRYFALGYKTVVVNKTSTITEILSVSFRILNHNIYVKQIKSILYVYVTNTFCNSLKHNFRLNYLIGIKKMV